MTAYPNLCYGPKFALSIDLFNHGAHDGLWWGEDYAFSRNWRALGGDIMIVPNINIAHHASATKDRPAQAFPGNFHKFMLKQKRPHGIDLPKIDPARVQALFENLGKAMVAPIESPPPLS